MYMEPGAKGTRAQRRRVVSLDDCPEILALMQMCLDQKRYDVWPCTDEAEAMCLLCFGEGIDVFTQDLDRPGGIGGVEFLRRMRGHPKLRRIPVLIVSGYPASAVREMLRHGGVERDRSIGFLEKPFTVAELAARIDALGGE